jgi:hypothetical protein
LQFSTPNIVYILADDLGIGDVQCLNRERGKIPTAPFDRLAASRMTFFDAHIDETREQMIQLEEEFWRLENPTPGR